MSISSSCVTSNVESHRYLNEAKASGGSSIVMLTILVLLLPTITAPTKMARPRSPALRCRFREESADSMAPCTFLRVPFDLMLAA